MEYNSYESQNAETVGTHENYNAVSEPQTTVSETGVIISDAKKRFLLPVVCVAGVAFIGFLIWLISYFTGPRIILDTYMDGLFNENGEKMMSCQADLRIRAQGHFVDDVEGYYQNLSESFVQYMENKVGKNPQFSFTIEDEHRATEDEREEVYGNFWGENYEKSVERAGVTDLYIYKGEITAEKNGHDVSMDFTMYVVKEENSWKIFATDLGR